MTPPNLHHLRHFALDCIIALDTDRRARIRDQRELCNAVLTLIDKVETTERLLFEALDYKQRYGDLVVEQNTIWDAARALGIDVSSPFPLDVWVWRYGGVTGQAASAGAALASAITWMMTQAKETQDHGHTR